MLYGSFVLNLRRRTAAVAVNDARGYGSEVKSRLRVIPRALIAVLGIIPFAPSQHLGNDVAVNRTAKDYGCAKVYSAARSFPLFLLF